MCIHVSVSKKPQNLAPFSLLGDSQLPGMMSGPSPSRDGRVLGSLSGIRLGRPEMVTEATSKSESVTSSTVITWDS